MTSDPDRPLNCQILQPLKPLQGLGCRALGIGFRDKGLGLRELRELRDPRLLKGILQGVHKGSIKGL